MTAKTAKLDMGFSAQEIDENRTRITGKGAGILGLGIGGVILFAFCTVLFALVLVGVHAILALAVLIGLPLAFHLRRSKRYSFDITDRGVEHNGTLYPFDDIGKVFVYNKALGGEQGSSTVVHTTGVASGAFLALGNASARAGARVLYQVGFMHGRKRVVLAKFINADTAESLFGYLTKDA